MYIVLNHNLINLLHIFKVCIYRFQVINIIWYCVYCRIILLFSYPFSSFDTMCNIRRRRWLYVYVVWYLPMHYYPPKHLISKLLNTPHSSSFRWCMLLVLIIIFHYCLLMLSTGYSHSKDRVNSRIIWSDDIKAIYFLLFVSSCATICHISFGRILTYNISHHRKQYDSDITLVIVSISYVSVCMLSRIDCKLWSSNFGVFCVINKMTTENLTPSRCIVSSIDILVYIPLLFTDYLRSSRGKKRLPWFAKRFAL